MKLKLGDKVTCKTAVDGYYSRYGGNREFQFKSGDIGVVAAVKVPSVTRENVTFSCVDWFCTETGRKERCALLPDNIIKV